MDLIVDIQYFPSVVLYKNLYRFSHVIFDQYEAYQKIGFRNRCQVAGAEGVVELSIPLVRGRGQKTLVRDVRISDRQPWAAQHWKAIVSCYSRSPWFDHYRDELGDLYRRRFDYLIDWDLACFDWSLRALEIGTGVLLTDRWVGRYAPEEAVDWRGMLRPRDREKGFGLELDDRGAGDKDFVRREDGPGRKVRYRQVFEERTGFIPNLSILDLLFCEGKNAMGRLGTTERPGNSEKGGEP